MNFSDLESILCKTFCTNITVRPVSSGLAISTAFEDGSGDRISFYLSEGPDGYRLEDDGDYLAELAARNVPFNEGVRGNLLDGILKEAGAFWDQETYEIKTATFSLEEVKSHIMPFLSSLIRVRDIEFLNREIVRSTFREDFIREAKERFSERIEIDEIGPIIRDFSEFPPDLILRPSNEPDAIPASVYLVNSNDKLNEALLAWYELERQNRHDFAIVGVIEDSDLSSISRKKFQRAQNRRLPMPIFRGDEDSAMSLVANEMRMGSIH